MSYQFVIGSGIVGTSRIIGVINSEDRVRRLDMPSVFLKDPDAVLEYKFDWKALTNATGNSNWLASGETISSHTVTVPSGITKDTDALTDTNTSVVVWLSGGSAGEDYEVACEIVTSAARTDERTIKIQVRER